MAEFLALTGEDGSQCRQSFPCVYHAGGIVGGVDDDSLRMRRQSSFQSIQTDLESLLVSRHHHQLRTAVLHEGTVLGEEGSDGHDLRILHCQSADHSDECRCGTAGEVDVFRPQTGIIAGVEIIGNSLPGIYGTGRGGIAVDSQRRFLFHDGKECVLHFLGRGDGGIAKRKVKDILLAHDGGAFQTVLKQVTDAGTFGAQLIHFLIDHNDLSPSATAEGRWLLACYKRGLVPVEGVFAGGRAETNDEGVSTAFFHRCRSGLCRAVQSQQLRAVVQ